MTATGALLAGIGQVLVPAATALGNGSGPVPILSPRSLASSAATITGTIAIDGAPLQVTLPVGDTARISFVGSAGQKLGLGFSAVSGPSRSVSVLKPPNGAELAFTSVSSSGAELDLSLPVDGTYTIVLNASSSASGSVTLTLSSDLVLPPVIDGDSTRVIIARPGQNARLTFSAANGDHLGLAVSDKTGSSIPITLLKPSGSTLLGSTTSAAVNEYDIDPLADGGYTLFLDLNRADTASATFTLSRDIHVTILPGLLPVPITIDRLGQNASLAFEVQTGDDVGIGLSDSSIPKTYVTLVGPGLSLSRVGSLADGMTYFSGPSGRGELDAKNLAGGTYRIVVDPDPNSAGVATGSVTVTLSHDVASTVQVGGPAVTFPMSFIGQNGRAFIDLVQGQSVQITYSNVTTQIEAQLRRPDAGLFRWGWVSGGATWTTTQIGPAPMTGRYPLRLDPWEGVASSAVIKVDGSPGGAVRVTGLGNLGEWLHASLDAVDPPDNGLPTYQWQRCDASGASCVDLGAEVDDDYEIEAQDLGLTIRVKVTVSNSFGSTTLTSSAVRILDTVQSVALQFRPYLFFDFGEHWRPLDVQNFLNETYDAGGAHRLCYYVTFPETNECIDSPAPTSFAPPYTNLDVYGSSDNASSFFTPYACERQVGGSDCDKGPNTRLYYEPTRDPVLGYLYLDYWWFYRFNDSPLPSGDHEGDWEGMTIVVDPTGPPNNTGGPVAAYTLYAAHDGSSWSAYLGEPGTSHAYGYVGQGTHATYPDPCSPEYGDLCGDVEVSYDGIFPWGRNDPQECADACVMRFLGGWVAWAGTWGINEEGSIPGGASPGSPANQDRFECTQGGYGSSCPTPPFAGVPAFSALRAQAGSPPISGPAGAASVCAAWEGRSAAVTVCQPALLRDTIRKGTISVRVRPNLTIRGYRGRISAARGVTQAIGQPLVGGQSAVAEGPLQAGTEIVVRVRDGHHRWVARFKLPSLGKGRKARIAVAPGKGRPSVSIRLPTRRLTPTFFALEK